MHSSRLARRLTWEYRNSVELPTLHHRKEQDATKTAAPDYRITCVFVDKRHGRRDVTELTTTSALDLIAQAGGGRVESYPHDLTHQTKKMSSSFPYTAPVAATTGRFHLGPAQWAEELRHGEDGRACMWPGHDQRWATVKRHSHHAAARVLRLNQR